MNKGMNHANNDCNGAAVGVWPAVGPGSCGYLDAHAAFLIEQSKETPEQKAKRERYLKENTFKIPRQPIRTWTTGGLPLTTDSGQHAKSKYTR